MPIDMTATKTVVKNKKAFHDYHILETYEAGLVLQGTEVKSIRAGSIHLEDSFARVTEGRLVLFNLDIAPYSHGNYMNHEPKRPRALLMHKREVIRLKAKTQQQGLTLVPLSLFFRRGIAKIELGLAQGKKNYDKREDLRKREVKRDMARAMGKRGGERS